LQCVLKSDVEREELLARERELIESMEARDAKKKAAAHAQESEEEKQAAAADGSLLAAVYERMEEIDASMAEPRASAILAGLGIDHEAQKRPTKTFSGGWRMRIAIARALFCEPDVLALDEPTNHLDLHACIWLEHSLSQWKKSLIVVSHDVEFLNGIATDIVHFDEGKLVTYKGNFDDFARTRAERLAMQAREHESMSRRCEHIQGFVDKFRFNAKRASLVQSRIKALEKMAVVPPVLDEHHFSFSFPSVGGSGADSSQGTIRLENVTFGYSMDKVLFRNIDVSVRPNSKIALVGANGAGKSTLMKLIAESDTYQPLEGFVYKSGKLRVGYFTQHFVDQLDLMKTPVECLAAIAPGVKEQELRSHIGTMGLSGDIVLRAVNTLSGGQKARVALALLTWQKPHCLLLDEPTNHLDIDTIDALVQALLMYDGGLMMISHDERLICGVCEELWCVEDGTVFQFDGDFEQYKKKILDI